MERLTQRDEFGNAEIIDVNSMKIEYDVGPDDYSKITDTINKLAKYEDLEEQGKLVQLSCTVDSEVWFVDKYAGEHTEIVRGIVDGFLWYRSCGFALNVVWDKPIMGDSIVGYKRKEIPFSDVGKTVFLTQEEAAEAKEMTE